MLYYSAKTPQNPQTDHRTKIRQEVNKKEFQGQREGVKSNFRERNLESLERERNN